MTKGDNFENFWGINGGSEGGFLGDREKAVGEVAKEMGIYNIMNWWYYSISLS